MSTIDAVSSGRKRSLLLAIDDLLEASAARRARSVARVISERMKAALKDIQSGKFAKDWVKEYQGGYKKYNALLKKGEKHPIEKTGAKLRAMMPWLSRKDGAKEKS